MTQPPADADPQVPGAPRISREALDRIVETLERRVLDELERRGLRNGEGVL